MPNCHTLTSESPFVSSLSLKVTSSASIQEFLDWISRKSRPKIVDDRKVSELNLEFRQRFARGY